MGLAVDVRVRTGELRHSSPAGGSGGTLSGMKRLRKRYGHTAGRRFPRFEVVYTGLDRKQHTKRFGSQSSAERFASKVWDDSGHRIYPVPRVDKIESNYSIAIWSV